MPWNPMGCPWMSIVSPSMTEAVPVMSAWEGAEKPPAVVSAHPWSASGSLTDAARIAPWY